MGRLTAATLGDVPAAARPAYAPGDLSRGMVHLGVGAFWRAHAAVYTDDVVAGGDTRWGVFATSQRSRTVPDTLAPQDGLYTVLERPAGEAPHARVVGVIDDVASAAEEPERVVDALASDSVHVVTLTVTEKGYRVDGSTGRLASDDETAADVDGRAPRTVVGQIVRGLQRRAAAGGGPIGVVSCDNLTGNGPLLARLVADFVDRLPAAEAEPLTGWIERHAAFPATMVDRIVPATTDADRDEVGRLLGLRDEACVVAEPFRQWVIADELTGPRPAWEQVGATLTDDVAAYERVKLRLLNATHSLIAYLGALAGYDTIAEAVADERIEAAARALIDRDQLPTVAAPDGLDLGAYRDQVLTRFANPALGHRTAQVAMDGSQKLPQRLLGAVRDRRADGAEPTVAALLLAAWMRALGAGRDDAGRPLDISDPMRERIAALVDRPVGAFEIARDVLGVHEVFGGDLVDDDTLVRAVADWYATLRDRGVDAALRQLSG